ncbi:hypothetical protein KA478_00950 [Patescibacteria group bacterium]|nr:hypothetical protein [Patescibacteria group bacterium]
MKKPSFWIGFVISVLIPCSSYALTTPVSINDSGIVGDQQSSAIAMTPDAKYVLFHSYATNLVANDTNGTSDVFVKNMLTNEITRVSVSSSGAQSDEASEPRAITPDGRYVLFDSAASNLTPSGSN